MATSILLPAQTEATSTEFTVEDAESVVVSIYTSNGKDLPAGPVLSLKRADINGNFINVATPGIGRVVFNNGSQQIVVSSPGTYLVYRPDLTPWDVDVGVQIN